MTRKSGIARWLHVPTPVRPRYNLEQLASDPSHRIKIAPSCCWQERLLSSRSEVLDALSGATVAIASAPCEPWLSTEPADDADPRAKVSYDLLLALIQEGALPDLRVVAIENAIKALCGASKRMNASLLACERAGWAGFTTPLAGNYAAGGSYPSAQAKKNAFAVLARCSTRHMHNIACAFADGLVPVPPVAADVIGKRWVYLSNRKSQFSLLISRVMLLTFHPLASGFSLLASSRLSILVAHFSLLAFCFWLLTSFLTLTHHLQNCRVAVHVQRRIPRQVRR